MRNGRTVSLSPRLSGLGVVFAALAMLAMLAVGCDTAADEAAGDDDLTYGSYNLEADDGGFDESSTMEAFSNVSGEDVSAFFSESDEEDVSADEDINPPEDIPVALTSYAVRIIWGQPFPNPLVEDAVDWSGSVSVSPSAAGALRVRRLIRFERRSGDRILPRTDRALVELVSRTLPHNDGLLLEVIRPAVDPAADATEADPEVQPGPATLSIDLGPISLTYDLDALAGLSDLHVVDDDGNVVSVQAVEVTREHRVCPHGFVAGYWKRLNRRGGVFGGRWIDASGEKVGELAGIWGMRRNGHRVLFGVYRKADGSFGGLLRGTYTPRGLRPHPEPGVEVPVDASDLTDLDTAPRPDGRFAARLRSADGTHLGFVQGAYTIAEQGEGGLRGRWALACPLEGDIATAQLPPLPSTDATATE